MSAIWLPISRTRCCKSSAVSPLESFLPISLLSRLRSAFNCCSAVSNWRRSASTRRSSSISASSPSTRVARRSRTKSGFSRIRRISSMARSVAHASRLCPGPDRKPEACATFTHTDIFAVAKLDLLAVGLGLATLAGVNLYLTVFVTGVAIHFHWVNLAPQYQSLEVLGDPWIITIAGVLYFMEFFADKIPWLDSVWDAVHTVIRPIGGALLAIQVLGHPSPAFTIIVALLAGGTSLVAHTAKA